MAITTHTKSTSPAFGIIGDVLLIAVSAFGGVFGRYRDASEKAETRRSLNKLSNKQLEDIGISRADIPSVVNELFSHKQ